MKKQIDFFGSRKIFFGISLAIILVGIVFNFIFGTQLDIQFKGGTILSYYYTGEIDQKPLEDLIQKATPDNQVTFTYSEELASVNSDTKSSVISVQFSGETTISPDLEKDILTQIQEKFPDNNFTTRESTSVEASMGVKFFLKCLTAVAIASVLMVLYVTIRFKKIGGLSAGVFALVALFHDVLMIYFLYIIFRMPLDSNFIAVVLMILGYSLNDTIVIYDRIREERRIGGAKMNIAEVFNKSMNAVISRTICTSITTLAAIATVYVVAIIFNLSSVQGFALPMIIGVISGCYSSICIAGPLWVMWQLRKKKKSTK